MNFSRVSRVMTGAALGFVFLFSIGVFTETTAQAQDRNRRWDRNDQRDRDRDRVDWSRRQQIERAREIERARAIERARQLQWERERARNRYAYSYPRNYPSGGGYYGNYGGYGGGSSSAEVQRGFRDGLDRGQEDLRDRRTPNPNNSSHYRSGNAAYREGFRRGYAEGYRQFGRGW